MIKTVFLLQRHGMNCSFELLEFLKNQDINASLRDPYWWPNSGSFEVVVGAVLTQQTKWERVEESLENLKARDLLSLEKLASLEPLFLGELIKSSGFFRQKSLRLIKLANEILNEFGDFENFQERVDREWLLAQKGIGKESADSILCYACKKEEMVVDRYTQILLAHFGYEFECYDEIANWLKEGLGDAKGLNELYGKEISLCEVYARFHGKIVEFCKNRVKKGVLKI